MYRHLLLFCICISLLGCGGAGRKYPVEPITEKSEFSSPLNQEMYANTGDEIFVSGALGKVKGLSMSGTINSSMPGAYGIPFSFYINKTTLQLLFQTDKHYYYCAPPNQSGASHSMLGNVMSPGDTAGVRISKASGSYEWFVDNSNHNRMTTIWSRDVTEDDHIKFSSVVIDVVDERATMKKITYDGLYSNLIHLTNKEIEGGRITEKEFSFDAKNELLPIQIGIHGNILEVLSVDNIGMKYKWIRIEQ